LNPLDPGTAGTLVRIAGLASDQHLSILLIGAFARDVLFCHIRGIATNRRTLDVDISVQLSGWDAYDELHHRMTSAGFARPDDDHPEKFRDTETGREVDLLPFGEIAENGKTVIWREDNSPWSVVGIQDAFDHALLLPTESDGIRRELPVISIPALVMLKIVAVHDRPRDRFKKDGTDIGFVIKHYLDAGNHERLFRPPEDDIMRRVGDDLDLATARLIGRDIAAICSPDTKEHIHGLLQRETTSRSRCPLVRGLSRTCGGSFPRALSLLASITEGLNEIRQPTNCSDSDLDA